MKQVIDMLDSAEDVIDMEHFVSEQTSFCGKIGRYILGDSKISIESMLQR